MKTVKLFCRVLVAVVALGAFAAPIVSAQQLGGVWFKLKLSAKGYTFDTNTLAVTKLSFSGPVYMQFVSINGGAEYNIYPWTQVNSVWTNASTGLESLIGSNQTFISDCELTFKAVSSGNYFDTYHTPFISIKTDGTGAFKSATYSGTGEIYDGNMNGKTCYGYFTLKGTSVAASKLPFTP